MAKAAVLFDANGSFGKKASGTPEFPTVRSRLDFMDRFGIARSLAWNVESTQHHAGAGNNAFLEQIRDTPDARGRMIACGNLDRLSGLKPCAPAQATVPAGNTLWPRFLEGKPLGVDAVDAHGHLGPSAGYVLEAQDERSQLPLALKIMDACGIRTMMISGLQSCLGNPVEGNDLLETLLKPHASRFQGYAAFNPFYAEELTARFKRYFCGPVFAGFKTLCDYWGVPITDARFSPMWEHAGRHRLPVLNHTWEGAHDSPAMFGRLAAKYPNVNFIIGHSGGGDQGRREAVELALKHKNVFLEWCGSFCSSMPWEETLHAVGARKIVFGTDAMAHDINWELGRLLSLDAPDKTLVPILGGNMRRILAMRR